MKVIFLDNDGVICLANNWGSRMNKRKKDKVSLVMNDPDVEVKYRFDYFDKKAIKVLNQVLEETGAEIVVSSDWRLYANLEELGEYYLSEGIIKKPIDVTKRYIGCDKPDEFEWFRSTMYEQQRCIEVRQYLIDHPEITHWACIDDLVLGEKDSYGFERKWGLSNFVHTPRENEGIKQSGVKEKLLEYLK
jgi:HAD domain in Swiss Army Knife RNA repair proteins